MTMQQSPEPDARGVFATPPGCRRTLVHLYQGGEYGLVDVFELFGLGELHRDVQEGVALSLAARELAELKVLADAYSFDHDEGFIAMCLDLHRFATAAPADRHRFDANF